MAKHLKTLIKDNILVYFLFLIVIAIVTLRQISHLDMLTILNDEFGYWGNAAVLVGIDWKDLLRETPFYSIGYSLTILPIIILVKDSALRYQTAIFFNAVYLFIMLCIAYKLIINNYISNNKKIASIIATLSVLTVANMFQSQTTLCEIFLTMQMWMLVLCIYELEKENSYINIIFTFVIMALMLSTHQRTIPVVVLGVIIVFWIQLKNSEIQVKKILIILALATVIFISYRFIKNYQLSNLYDNSGISDVNNANMLGMIGNYCNRMFSSFWDVVRSFIGKVVAASLSTFFIVFTATISTVLELKRCISSRKVNEISASRVFSILCFWCMLVLTTFQMLGDGRKDLVVYTRYFDMTVGPVIMLGLCELCNHWNKWKKCFVVEGVITCVLLCRVINWVINANDYMNVTCSPYIGSVYRIWGILKIGHPTINIVVLSCCIGLGALITVLCYAAVTKDNAKAIIGLVMLVFNLWLSSYSYGWLMEAREDYKSNIKTITDMILADGSDVYYIKYDGQLDGSYMQPKYIQFLLGSRPIHVVYIDELDNLTEDSWVLISNQFSIESKNIELIEESRTLRLYKK